MASPEIREAVQSYRSPACPDDTRLESYARGELGWFAGYRVARHLRTCPACMSVMGRQWPAHARTRESVRLVRRQTALPLVASMLLCVAVLPALTLSPLSHPHTSAVVQPLPHSGQTGPSRYGAKGGVGIEVVQNPSGLDLSQSDEDIRKALTRIDSEITDLQNKSVALAVPRNQRDRRSLAMYSRLLEWGYAELYARTHDPMDKDQWHENRASARRYELQAGGDGREQGAQK